MHVGVQLVRRLRPEGPANGAGEVNPAIGGDGAQRSLHGVSAAARPGHRHAFAWRPFAWDAVIARESHPVPLKRKLHELPAIQLRGAALIACMCEVGQLLA